MYLFYAPDITPPLHTLAAEESKHCVRVLRLGRGDTVHITDGRGNLFCCAIENGDPRRCTVRVVSVDSAWEPLPYRLTMAVAPTKNADRYEWFLEKATEVGVAEFIPLETARSERRVFKPERAGKVVTAAMKQSLKAYRPLLHDLTPFREAVGMPFEGRKFIAHCDAARTPGGKAYLPAALRAGEAALVFIGPEGDFSSEEVDLALAHGFEEITLGSQRLRTETAAVAATVMVSVVNGMGCGASPGPESARPAAAPAGKLAATGVADKAVAAKPAARSGSEAAATAPAAPVSRTAEEPETSRPEEKPADDGKEVCA